MWYEDMQTLPVFKTTWEWVGKKLILFWDELKKIKQDHIFFSLDFLL